MKGKVCPKCGEPSVWEKNPHRPFCSERCRLLDLEAWLGGRYRVPIENDHINMSHVEQENQDSESRGL